MPASWGTLQDPQDKESPASRIQRCSEVQLNGATQQLAFLSTGFSKYLIAVQCLVLHTHTHRLAGSHGFIITIAIVCGPQRCVHISIHSGTASGRRTSNSVQDVAPSERGRKLMDALQEACSRKSWLTVFTH